MNKKKNGKDTLEAKLDQWAVKLVDRNIDATGKETPTIAEETGAFKAVTLYYAYKMKLSPPPKDEENFGGWRDKIAGTGRGNGRRAVATEAGTDPEF